MGAAGRDEGNGVSSILAANNDDDDYDDNDNDVDVVGSILPSLASKSSELRSLPDADLLDIANDLLHNLRSREKEWSEAAGWCREEARLLGFLRDGGDGVDCLLPASAKRAGSGSRQILGSIVCRYLTTYASALEHRIASTRRDEEEQRLSAADGIAPPEESSASATATAVPPLPDLLSKTRTEETEEGNATVHGPVPVPNVPGHAFEVWTTPDGIGRSDLDDGDDDDGGDTTASMTAEEENDGAGEGGVALVLGAGNQPFLTAIDALHCCLLKRKPILIKHHPLRPHLIHPYRILLEPLERRGYASQVLDRGMPRVQEMLGCHLVRHVHVTGSYGTARAIEKTLKERRPDLAPKTIESMLTSELGCATPWIVSPGAYTTSELRNAVASFVGSKKANGGCNCLSGQIVVLPREWDQRDEFRRMLVEELEDAPKDPIYYPGSLEKRRSSLARHRGRASVVRSSLNIDVAKLEEEGEDDDDLVLIDCGTPGEEGYDGSSLLEEAFGPVASIVELSGPKGPDQSPGSYLLETAIPFVNDKSNVFGSLSCTLLFPSSLLGDDDRPMRTKAIGSLRYGTVSVNGWTVLGYLAAVSGAVWGGHPRDGTRQSGRGFVGDQYGIPRAEKTVLLCPPLTSRPLFRKGGEPPPIVFDALHAAAMAGPSTMNVIAAVVRLLVVRTVGALVPGWVWRRIGMGGRLSYGAAL